MLTKLFHGKLCSCRAVVLSCMVSSSSGTNGDRACFTKCAHVVLWCPCAWSHVNRKLEYAEVSTELRTNVAARTKVNVAIDTGMTGGFPADR